MKLFQGSSVLRHPTILLTVVLCRLVFPFWIINADARGQCKMFYLSHFSTVENIWKIYVFNLFCGNISVGCHKVSLSCDSSNVGRENRNSISNSVSICAYNYKAICHQTLWIHKQILCQFLENRTVCNAI